VSTGQQRPDSGGSEGEPTEEELRAAYEEQVKQIRVEHVLLENVVTLVNLGMRRTGLHSGTESERDPAQVQLAIESVRALLPLLEQSSDQQVGPIRDALSQLQLAFVRIGGPGGESAPGQSGDAQSRPADPAGAQPPPQDEPADPGAPGPAQRSGRLWVPGQ
jgi:hypothetical protein